jgi:hypothetical protein
MRTEKHGAARVKSNSPPKDVRHCSKKTEAVTDARNETRKNLFADDTRSWTSCGANAVWRLLGMSAAEGIDADRGTTHQNWSGPKTSVNSNSGNSSTPLLLEIEGRKNMDDIYKLMETQNNLFKKVENLEIFRTEQEKENSNKNEMIKDQNTKIKNQSIEIKGLKS